jgi:hypothetical protein
MRPSIKSLFLRKVGCPWTFLDMVPMSGGQGVASSNPASPTNTLHAIRRRPDCSRRPTSAVLFPPSSPPMRVAHRTGGGEASIDDTEDASDERAEAPALDGGGAATPSPEAGGGAPDAASALIDQARPWGVRRLRAQLRVAMSRPRGRSRRVCSIFIRFRSPELAGLANSLSVKVTTKGTHTTLWK